LIFDNRAIDIGEWTTCRLRWCQRRKGLKVHIAVEMLERLLTLHVTAVDERDRTQVDGQVQEATGEMVEVAYADQG
jgi:hypothetical protein